MAAVHRAGVNAAVRSVAFRRKLAARKYRKEIEGSIQLATFARNMAVRSQEIQKEALERFSLKERQLNAAENLVMNAQDDLNDYIRNA